MEQLKVCLVRFPFTNMIDYKIRPALIISNQEFNKKHNYFWCCPITTKQSKNSIELTEQNFEGELKTRSFVRTDSIAGIEKELFLKEIGTISKESFEEIKNKLIQNL